MKYVIIAGGYNDKSATLADITSGMSDCKTIVASKFPNATMCVAFIGTSTNASTQTQLATAKQNYASAATSLSVTTLNYTDTLTASDIASDGIHPNDKGEQKIAKGIVTAMNNQL